VNRQLNVTKIQASCSQTG